MAENGLGPDLQATIYGSAGNKKPAEAGLMKRKRNR